MRRRLHTIAKYAKCETYSDKCKTELRQHCETRCFHICFTISVTHVRTKFTWCSFLLFFTILCQSIIGSYPYHPTRHDKKSKDPGGPNGKSTCSGRGRKSPVRDTLTPSMEQSLQQGIGVRNLNAASNQIEAHLTIWQILKLLIVFLIITRLSIWQISIHLTVRRVITHIISICLLK